jgi:hypothetical protein
MASSLYAPQSGKKVFTFGVGSNKGKKLGFFGPCMPQHGPIFRISTQFRAKVVPIVSITKTA